jgi:hypothetical protein
VLHAAGVLQPAPLTFSGTQLPSSWAEPTTLSFWPHFVTYSGTTNCTGTVLGSATPVSSMLLVGDRSMLPMVLSSVT